MYLQLILKKSSRKFTIENKYSIKKSKSKQREFKYLNGVEGVKGFRRAFRELLRARD